MYDELESTRFIVLSSLSEMIFHFEFNCVYECESLPELSSILEDFHLNRTANRTNLNLF